MTTKSVMALRTLKSLDSTAQVTQITNHRLSTVIPDSPILWMTDHGFVQSVKNESQIVAFKASEWIANDDY